jgi:hypothetical protein
MRCLFIGGPCDGFHHIYPHSVISWKFATYNHDPMSFDKMTEEDLAKPLDIKTETYHRTQPHVFLHESEL